MCKQRSRENKVPSLSAKEQSTCCTPHQGHHYAVLAKSHTVLMWKFWQVTVRGFTFWGEMDGAPKTPTHWKQQHVLLTSEFFSSSSTSSSEEPSTTWGWVHNQVHVHMETDRGYVHCRLSWNFQGITRCHKVFAVHHLTAPFTQQYKYRLTVCSSRTRAMLSSIVPFSSSTWWHDWCPYTVSMQSSHEYLHIRPSSTPTSTT